VPPYILYRNDPYRVGDRTKDDGDGCGRRLQVAGASIHRDDRSSEEQAAVVNGRDRDQGPARGKEPELSLPRDSPRQLDGRVDPLRGRARNSAVRRSRHQW